MSIRATRGLPIPRLTYVTAGLVLLAGATGGGGAGSSAGSGGSSQEPPEARRLVEAAIEAHGGLEPLRTASEWVAEIRRHQRGESYVVTARYRPGMVRLEVDLGAGERSADVIGHPHCWGMIGPASFPCSSETRENDRPRVVMEMAAQLWPLLGDGWRLDEAIVHAEGDRVVRATYLPLDTEALLTFDDPSLLLRRIESDGVKEGVLGTHRHDYSVYEERCGVRMPMRNEKSFEGEIWVAEEILEIHCQPVDEALFVRPPQVTEGAIVLRREGEDRVLSLFTLKALGERAASLEEALRAEAAKRSLEVSGPLRIERYDHDGMGPTGELVIELQLPIVEMDQPESSTG